MMRNIPPINRRNPARKWESKMIVQGDEQFYESADEEFGSVLAEANRNARPILALKALAKLARVDDLDDAIADALFTIADEAARCTDADPADVRKDMDSTMAPADALRLFGKLADREGHGGIHPVMGRILAAHGAPVVSA